MRPSQTPPHAPPPPAPRTGDVPHVVVEPRPGSDVVAVAVTVGSGGADDPPGRSGLAHLVEHLMFRRAGGHTHRVTRLGGQANATTHPDHTVYHVLVPADRLDEVVALEAERFRGSGAEPDPAVLEAERAVVRVEIAAAAAAPGGGFPWPDVARRVLGRPGEARTPHGDPDQLPDVTVADCARFARGRMRASALAVSVVGGVHGPADRVADRVRAAFSGLPAGPAPARPTAPPPGPPAVLTGAAATTPLVAFAAPVPPPGRDLPGYLAHVVLARIVQQRLREPGDRPRPVRAAAAGVGPRGRWLQRRPDVTDALVVRLAGGPGAGPAALVDALSAELDAVLREGPDPADLRRAVTTLLLELHHAEDDPVRHACALGRAAVLGLPSSGAVPAALRRVDADAVARAGRLPADAATVAAVPA